MCTRTIKQSDCSKDYNTSKPTFVSWQHTYALARRHIHAQTRIYAEFLWLHEGANEKIYATTLIKSRANVARTSECMLFFEKMCLICIDHRLMKVVIYMYIFYIHTYIYIQKSSTVLQHALFSSLTQNAFTHTYTCISLLDSSFPGSGKCRLHWMMLRLYVYIHTCIHTCIQRMTISLMLRVTAHAPRNNHSLRKFAFIYIYIYIYTYTYI